MAINATNYDGTKDYKIAEVGDVYHPNLLVNGDFQCNQRGKSSYSTTSSRVSALDMWSVAAYSGGSASFNTNGNVLSLSNSGEFSQNTDIPYNKYENLTIVISAKKSGNYERYSFTFTGVPSKLTADNANVSHGFSDIGVLAYLYRYKGNIRVMLRALNSGSTSINIEYVDLFEGSIAYPHVKEDYATALMRCMPWIETGRYVVYKEGHAYIMGFNYRCKKMSTPTITFSDGSNADGAVTGTFTAVSQNVDSCPFIRHDGSAINGQITLSTTISCEPL